MASQGPLSPATVVSDPAVGTLAWATPADAVSSNNADATALELTTTRQISEYLKATSFGFTVPAGATIDGIVVDVERKEATTFDNITDEHVKIVKGGTVGTTNKADTVTEWPTADAYATYGSVSDLWGETWTDTDINAATFGVVVSADIGGDGFASVDHIRVTVHYTEAAVVAAASFPFRPLPLTRP